MSDRSQIKKMWSRVFYGHVDDCMMDRDFDDASDDYALILHEIKTTGGISLHPDGDRRSDAYDPVPLQTHDPICSDRTYNEYIQQKEYEQAKEEYQQVKEEFDHWMERYREAKRKYEEALQPSTIRIYHPDGTVEQRQPDVVRPDVVRSHFVRPHVVRPTVHGRRSIDGIFNLLKKSPAGEVTLKQINLLFKGYKWDTDTISHCIRLLWRSGIIQWTANDDMELTEKAKGLDDIKHIEEQRNE